MEHSRAFAVIGLIGLVCFGSGTADTAAQQSSIDVAVYFDQGAWESGVIAFESFLDWKKLTHERVNAAMLNSNPLVPRYKSIYFPGGYAYDYKVGISARGERHIRELVSGGGAYVGICAGAYFACDRVDWEGGSYPYTLGLFKGTVRGSIPGIAPWPEYAMTSITTNSRHPINAFQPASFRTLYFGGPTFHPDVGVDVDTIATWDQASGQCAIIGFPYGAGRVLLVGPHPEIEENDGRDGTDFGFELSDPDTEWGFLWSAMDWVLGMSVTDTLATEFAGAEEALPQELELRSCFPNPVRDHATVEITAPLPARIWLELADMPGRTRKVFFDREIAAGRNLLHLNLPDGADAIPTGVYMLRLAFERGVRTVRISVIR